MNYASVCSGIEAPSVAWEALGWTPAWFSEIESFPCAVLRHHYPNVPNLGDMTKIHETETFKQSAIDLLIGGTPCQSFSLAGLRKGLDDPRGNLMLTFLALIDRKRPRWIIWENVPGVLSSWSDTENSSSVDGVGFKNGRTIEQTNDFDTFLSGLRELGYGVSWRICDAQYWGVAQRRRRVFVVGYLGDWRPPAAVLFERKNLQGHPAPSRKTGQDIAGTLTSSADRSRGAGIDPAHIVASTGDVSHCLNAGGMGRQDFESETLVAYTPAGFGQYQEGVGTLRSSGGDIGLGSETIISECYGVDEECNATDNFFGPLLRGPQGGTRQAVAYRTAGDGGIYEEGNRTATLTTGTDRSANVVAIPYDLQQVTSPANSQSNRKDGDPAPTLGRDNAGNIGIVNNWRVRRLTPTECARLQGFQDNYLNIPYNGKPVPADGPIYKAYGNSIAVPVLRWIGQRISAVSEIIRQH